MEEREKRQHIRIGDTLVFEYCVLSEDEYRQEKEIFYQQPSGVEKVKLKYPFLSLPFSGEKVEEQISHSSLNQVFLGLLVSINEKLENLLKIMAKSGNKKCSLHCKEPAFINISGAGIRLITEEFMEPGTKLRIIFLLPIFPTFEIKALGEVVWTKPKENKYEVGINFLEIHEDDREALIYYIFRRQRKLIREGKK